ncbi:TPR repeat-containing protein [Heterostelium album PN500]|uniref:TPR repeat-containing protein n=1 Tax=Heterostelium pallidum (strain ATCC 26659 / Pp 5 / PN500) TaxID=670386 RepID=D3B3Z4_HETP5|nr:TPR repeat-containing protein [Heterostelium album PN500]EFA84042.1 TPR repeat-containing protein [Heterostelium album PN500]|eukprot:XP_020436159.1 TPR repeat-containing protein [Heterostelium album PN500]
MGCCCGKEKKEKVEPVDSGKSMKKLAKKKDVDHVDSKPTSLYVGAEKYDKRELEERLQENPNDVDALTTLGVVLANEGRDKEALEALKKATEIDKESSKSWVAYAEFYERKKDPKKAQEIYKEGYKYASPKIALDSNDSDLMLHYALNCQNRGDMEKAEKLFRKVITSGPTNVRGLGLYATFVLQHEKDIEKASNYFKQAADVEPASAYWCQRYGEFLRDNLKNTQEANIYFKKSALAV